jgi:hypothetical protein
MEDIILGSISLRQINHIALLLEAKYINTLKLARNNPVFKIKNNLNTKQDILQLAIYSLRFFLLVAG